MPKDKESKQKRYRWFISTTKNIKYMKMFFMRRGLPLPQKTSRHQMQTTIKYINDSVPIAELENGRNPYKLRSWECDIIYKRFNVPRVTKENYREFLRKLILHILDISPEIPEPENHKELRLEETRKLLSYNSCLRVGDVYAALGGRGHGWVNKWNRKALLEVIKENDLYIGKSYDYLSKRIFKNNERGMFIESEWDEEYPSPSREIPHKGGVMKLYGGKQYIDYHWENSFYYKSGLKMVDPTNLDDTEEEWNKEFQKCHYHDETKETGFVLNMMDQINKVLLYEFKYEKRRKFIKRRIRIPMYIKKQMEEKNEN